MTPDLNYEWFRLNSIKGIGNKSLHKIRYALTDKMINMADLWGLSFAELREIGLTTPVCLQINKREDDSSIREAYGDLLAKNIAFIHLQHDDYPRWINGKLGNEAPACLFCLGETSIIHNPCISIAGSRNASEVVLNLTKRIASDLAENGFTIVSGYAKGIDTAAHIGALEAGGKTVKILYYGIENYRKKVDFREFDPNNTLVVSQFGMNTGWHGHNAMERNKLITALSKALLIVESADETNEDETHSGSFNAGMTALELNIPLLVYNLTSIGIDSPGNKKLIEYGGIKVTAENIQDVIESL